MSDFQKSFWKERKTLAPFIVAAVILFFLGLGILSYERFYEIRASRFLARAEAAETQEEVVNRFPRSDAAQVARVRLGQRALEEQKFDEAIQWYLKVVEKKSASSLLRVASLQNISLAYLKKKDFAQAKFYLEKAQNDPGNLQKDYTRFLLAKVYEEEGQKESAHQIYQELSQGSSDMMLKREAEKRVAPPAVEKSSKKTSKKIQK